MKKARVVMISIVLGLSLGTAVQFGMFNGLSNGALGLFNDLFPNNVGTNASGSAGNNNNLLNSNYQASQKDYFDRDLQAQLLDSSFGLIDGGFSTSHQITVGVSADMYFDFETGSASTASFTTADFFWTVDGNYPTINVVNGAAAKDMGLVPFSSVDASSLLSSLARQNLTLADNTNYNSYSSGTAPNGDPGTSGSFEIVNNTVFVWKTAENNILRMKVTLYGNFLSVTYDSIYYFSIDGNDDFLATAAANNWPGEGTASDPIMIENYQLSSALFGGFSIANTNLHFVMNNNTLDGQGSDKLGVVLDNVVSGSFTNNTVSGYAQAFSAFNSSNLSYYNNVVVGNAQEGFFIESSASVSYSKNKLSKNGGSGILVYESYKLVISNNTFDGNSLMAVRDPTVLSASISLVASSSATAIYNKISGSYGMGVMLFAATGNSVKQNTITGSAQDGVYVLGSESSAVGGNTIDSNNGRGVAVSSSIYMEVSENTIMNSGEDGLSWINSSFGSITGNTITGSTNPVPASAKTNGLTTLSIYSGMFMDPSYFNTISGNTISGNGVGVFMQGSDYNTFSTNTISNNAQDGFDIINSSSNIIDTNTITGNSNPTLLAQLKPDSLATLSIYSGMFMDPSSNNTLTNNHILSNYGYGLHTQNSDYNTIDSNTVNSNAQDGAFIENSDSNKITNNDFSSNSNPQLQYEFLNAFKAQSITTLSIYSGMFMDPSTNNVVANNTFDSNYGNGIYVQSSNANFFESNNATNNAQNGVFVENSHGNNINNNVLTGNGNPALLSELLSYGKVNGLSTLSIYSGMFMDPSTKNNVNNNHISDNYGYGYWLQGSDGNVLDSNSVTGNAFDGVFVQDSNSNHITNNDFSSNSNPDLQVAVMNLYNSFKPGSITTLSIYSGMFMDPSSGNYVAGNTFNDNPGRGIWVQESSNNVFDSNTITNSGQDGFALENSSYNNVTSNTIENSGNSVVLNSFLAYGKVSGVNTLSIYSGMFMDPSVGNVVAYNKISDNNGYGVASQDSSNNALFYNVISHNTAHGFYSENSNGNSLSYNAFTSNTGYGTYFDSQSQSSDVTHNDYVANNQDTGNKQGYDDGGNTYLGNFFMDANPNTPYLLDGSSGSYDPEPALSPNTDLSSTDLQPITVGFYLRSWILNIDSHGRYMDAKIKLPDGYSAYLTNTTTFYAEWNGHTYPMKRVYIQSSDTIHVKFDKRALMHDLQHSFHEHHHHRYWYQLITITIHGQFNGGSLSFTGSDSIYAFDR